MSVLATINERRHKYGMPVAELARRVGMDYAALYCALMGKRKLEANEFLSVCEALGLTLEDFNHDEIVNGIS